MKKPILSRRDFLRLASMGTLAGAGGALLAAVLKGEVWGNSLTALGAPRTGDLAASSKSSNVAKWLMVIDLARCDGCRKCTLACGSMHFVPPGQEWIKVYTMEPEGLGSPYWFPRPCMQCDNPPCVKVCPVGATYKRADGIVMQDQERCIGCRLCMAACPYAARSFNWGEPPHSPEELSRPYSVEWNFPHRRGVVEKCIFCPAATYDGNLPGCVSGCPAGALYFGNEHVDVVSNSLGETVRLSQHLTQGAAFRFMEDLGTKPRVYYLPPRDRQYLPPSELNT